MKNLFLLFFFFILNDLSYSQTTLNGAITYQNTGKKIEKLQVTSFGSTPTTTISNLSNKKGLFSLYFPYKVPRDFVLLSIENPRYEIVNHPRELRVKLSSNPDSLIRLVVCRKGERDQNAINYYDIATEHIEKKYEEEKSHLNQEISNLQYLLNNEKEGNKIFEKDVLLANEKLSQLYSKHKRLLDKAWILAEEFSRIDLAQEDDIINRAFKAFQKGEIKNARVILENSIYNGNLSEIKRLEKDISDIENSTEKAKLFLIEVKIKMVEKVLLSVKLAEIDFDFDSVNEMLSLALNVDSTNYNALIAKIMFHKGLYEYVESIDLLNKALKYSKDTIQISNLLTELANIYILQDEFGKADTLLNQAYAIKSMFIDENSKALESILISTLISMGNLYFYTNQSDKIDSVYIKMIDILRVLSNKDSEIYLEPLGKALSNYGLINYYMRKLKKAELILNEAVEIRASLLKEMPSIPRLIDMALTYNNLGNVFYFKNKLLADSIYQIATDYFLEVEKYNPILAYEDLSEIYNNRGLTFKGLSKFNEADSLLKRSLNIRRDLAALNPNVFDEDVAETLNNLGNLSILKWDYSNALDYHEESLTIRRKLAKKASAKYTPKLAESLTNVGEIYIAYKDYYRADSVLSEAIQIRRKLVITDSISYSSLLASSLNLRGIIYIAKLNFVKAKKDLQEALKLGVESIRIDSSNTFNIAVHARSLSNLGLLNYKTNNYEEAEDYYLKALELYKFLALNNSTIQVKVSNTLDNLAEIYCNIGKCDQGQELLKQSEITYHEFIDMKSLKFCWHLSFVRLRQAKCILAVLGLKSDKTLFNDGINSLNEGETYLNKFDSTLPIIIEQIQEFKILKKKYQKFK